MCPIHPRVKLGRSSALWVAQCCGLLIPVDLLVRLQEINAEGEMRHYRLRHGGSVLVLERR